MRRRYKLLSWDYPSNAGLATDGTKWDSEPITFTVNGADLAPEYNGFLNIGEVFTAEESPNRILYDIFVEEGPRSNPFSQMHENEPDQIIHVDGDPDFETIGQHLTKKDIRADEKDARIAKTIADLQRRVIELERRVSPALPLEVTYEEGTTKVKTSPWRRRNCF